MKTEVLLSILENTPGGFVYVRWERDLDILKRYVGDVKEVKKVTEMGGQVGVTYDNRKTVQEGRETGELPAENQGLDPAVWQWVKFPYVRKSVKTGADYLVLTPTSASLCKVQFLANGEEVKREMLDGVVGAKDWKPREHAETDVILVKVDGIVNLSAAGMKIETK